MTTKLIRLIPIQTAFFLVPAQHIERADQGSSVLNAYLGPKLGLIGPYSIWLKHGYQVRRQKNYSHRLW